MISFYPGPSKVYEEIPRYVKDAHTLGILSMNHRSEAFMRLCEKTIRLLKKKIDIPKSYSVFFTCSSTECWEIIAQSLIQRESIHLFNGAFGKKWFDYTKRLRPEAQAFPFNREDVLMPRSYASGEVIAITQNETSNGTAVNCTIIKKIKELNPDNLIAVDATSSMGGIHLDFTSADVWFASVQKCFGLPAGLGILICSPRAMEKAAQLDEQNHYNSLTFLRKNMEQWQTPYTPNVLAIYLLMRTLQQVAPIEKINRKLIKRAQRWYKFFAPSKKIRALIKNQDVRSNSVITVEGQSQLLDSAKTKATKKGLLLGEGYGDLKKETFRIANFPALKKKEIQKLEAYLSKYR